MKACFIKQTVPLQLILDISLWGGQNDTLWAFAHPQSSLGSTFLLDNSWCIITGRLKGSAVTASTGMEQTSHCSLKVEVKEQSVGIRYCYWGSTVRILDFSILPNRCHITSGYVLYVSQDALGGTFNQWLIDYGRWATF